MFWDIVIAVAAALMQGLTAFLGWHVTLNPLIPGNPKYGRKRRIYTGLFVFSGLVGVFLVGLAAYRAPRERAHLGTMLVPTYQQSDASGRALRPTWLNGASFLRVDKKLAFNVIYQDVGNGSALGLTIHMYSFIEPDQTAASENDALAQFERMKASDPYTSSLSVPKGMTEWGTAHGPILSPEDYNNLVSGRRVVYVIAEFLFSDAAGKHFQHYCQTLQPPLEGGELIWGNCRRYNDED